MNTLDKGLSCSCSNIQSLKRFVRVELPVILNSDNSSNNEKMTKEKIYSRMGGRDVFEESLISTLERSPDFNEKDILNREYKRESPQLTFALRPSDPHQLPIISNIDKKPR